MGALVLARSLQAIVLGDELSGFLLHVVHELGPNGSATAERTARKDERALGVIDAGSSLPHIGLELCAEALGRIRSLRT
jgi:hypothetical protein